jgi:capsular exopolysaccharide synthesis family protein
MAANNERELDLRHGLRVLRRRAVLIIVMTVSAFVGVYLLSSMRTSLYSATAEVQISDPAITSNFSNGNNSNNNNEEADRNISNQIHFIESKLLRSNVRDELGRNASAMTDLSVSWVEDTDVIGITTSATSPEIAAEAANTYASVYVEERKARTVSTYRQQAENLRAAAEGLARDISRIDEQLSAAPEGATSDLLVTQRATLVANRQEFISGASQLDLEANLRSQGVQVLDEATLPAGPYSPVPLRDATIAAVIALVLGIGIAFLLDWLDNRVASPDQLESLVPEVPVLGAIPVHGSQRRWQRHLPRERHLVAPSSPAVEAYRTLQTSLRFSRLGKTKQRIAVTSSSGGEGKTTVTANLAMVLAESGLRVVVVSADLRKPMIGSVFGVDESERGLTSVLLGDAELADCLVPVTFESGRSIYLLPAGPLPHNPAELLGSEAFGTLLERIESAGVDFILLDCAPVLPVSDPLAVAQHVDGMVVLALVEHTKLTNLIATIERLQQVEADIIGIVLNGIPHRHGYHGRYYGYYRYGYGYGYGHREPGPAPDEKAADGNGSGSHDDRAMATHEEGTSTPRS